MKIKIRTIAALATGVMLFGVVSAAQAAEFYIGLGAGKTTLETGIANTTGTAKLDEDDTGKKIFAGVHLNKFISIEAFYADLGEASLSGNNGDTFQFNGSTFAFTANNVKITSKGKGFGIAPMVGYNITENFRPFAKIGVHRWDIDTTATTSAGSASISNSGTDLMFGLGLAYSFTKNIGIRAEYERFKFDGDDADLISASIQYTF